MSTTPVGWRSEFIVNTTTAGNQAEPSVTALANGGFVVVWQDNSHAGDDTTGSSVRARFLDANGNPLGADFVVNTTTVSDQFSPVAVQLANGNVAVVWTDASATGGDTSVWAVRGQILSQTGAKVGGEILINSDDPFGNQYLADIIARPDGGFVAAWRYSDASNEHLELRHFNADGQALSGTRIFGHDYDNGGKERNVSLATLSNGNFVAAWTQTTPAAGDGNLWTVEAQVFSFNQTSHTNVSAILTVNTTATGYQFNPSVTGLTGGGFVVTWIDGSATGADTSSWAIRGQVFTATGGKVGEEFVVNTVTAEAQYYPSVTALLDGGFMAVWDDWSQTATNNVDIHGQRFDELGNKVGTQLRLNAFTAGGQTDADTATLADGRVVVVWQDGSHVADTSEFAIHMAIADPREGVPTSLPHVLVTNANGAGDPLAKLSAVLASGVYGAGNVGQFFYNTPTDAVVFYGSNFTYGAGSALTGGLITNFRIGIDGVEMALATNWMQDAVALVDAVAAAQGGNSTALDAILTSRSYTIEGAAGADLIAGFSGDDRLIGRAGNDTLVGNAGVDTAVFSGERDDYAVTLSGGSVSVRDLRVDSPEGTDTVSSVENFQFADGTVALADLNHAPTSISLSAKKILANSSAGTVVATISGVDQDPGDQVAFSLSDPSGNFEIVGGNKLVVKAASAPLGNYAIDVTATDLSGATRTQTFTIQVTAGTPATVFTANDGIHGSELYVSDGTESGTVLLRDINPGSASSSVGQMWYLGDKVYFAANDGVSGSELWVTDGTAAGTVLLKDINPGSAGSSPQNLVAFGDRIFFTATDAAHGQEMWVTDGTASGTVLFRDFNPGTLNSGAAPTTAVLDGKMFFRGTNGSGYEGFNGIRALGHRRHPGRHRDAERPAAERDARHLRFQSLRVHRSQQSGVVRGHDLHLRDRALCQRRHLRRHDPAEGHQRRFGELESGLVRPGRQPAGVRRHHGGERPGAVGDRRHGRRNSAALGHQHRHVLLVAELVLPAGRKAGVSGGRLDRH